MKMNERGVAHVPGVRCPNCRQRIDGQAAATTDDGAPRLPQPGDPTVCSFCGALAVFARAGSHDRPSLRLRAPTDLEVAELALDPAVQAAKRDAARLRAVRERDRAAERGRGEQ